MIMQEVTPLLRAAGNARFWNMQHTHPMSPRDYDISDQVKEPLGGTRCNTRDELSRAIGRSIRNIIKNGRADGVLRLPNVGKL